MNTFKHILLLFILSALCGADLVRANEKQAPTVVYPSDSPVLFGVISTDMPLDMRKELGTRIASGEGLCVTAVSRFSPAEEAGIRPVDIILKVAGQPVATKLDLLMILQKYKPGDTIPVHVLRLDQTKELNLTLGNRSGLQQNYRMRKDASSRTYDKQCEEAVAAVPDCPFNFESPPSPARDDLQFAWSASQNSDQKDLRRNKTDASKQPQNNLPLPPATMNQKTDLVPTKMEQIQCLQNTIITQLTTDNPDRSMVQGSLLKIRALASGRTDQGNAAIHLEDTEGQIIINGSNQHVTVETIPEKKKAGTTYRLDIPSKSNPLPEPVRKRLRDLNQ